MKRLVFFIPFFIAIMPLMGQTGAIKAGMSVLYNTDSKVTGIGGGLTFEYSISRKMTFAGVLDYTTGKGTL
jgi:hypothetical protein